MAVSPTVQPMRSPGQPRHLMKEPVTKCREPGRYTDSPSTDVSEDSKR